MEKLKGWLQMWLGITPLSNGLVERGNAMLAQGNLLLKIQANLGNARSDIENLKIWNKKLDSELAEANTEIDRLRAIVCTTPEVKAQTFKPRRWSDAKQLLGQGL